MAEKNPTPDVQTAMNDAEEAEKRTRRAREQALREHNRRVLEAHQAQAVLQAELADRAVAAVPIAVEAGSSWWGKYGHVFLGGVGGAASLWGLEWSAHKVRQTLRGRR